MSVADPEGFEDGLILIEIDWFQILVADDVLAIAPHGIGKIAQLALLIREKCPGGEHPGNFDRIVVGHVEAVSGFGRIIERSAHLGIPYGHARDVIGMDGCGRHGPLGAGAFTPAAWYLHP